MLIKTFKPFLNRQSLALTRCFAGGRPTWDDFRKSQGKFGKDQQGAYRAEYEREVRERTERRLNWNIKNRWEQRALDDVLMNKDIREAQFRDYSKTSKNVVQLQEFHSVDEIYFFMD